MVAFNRIVLSGTLASGAEVFSTSCAFWRPEGDPVSTQAGLADWASDIMADLDTIGLSTELKNGLSSTGAVTEVRAYFYPSETTTAAAVGISNGSVPGLLSPSRPTSVAAVFSLSTGLAGRRYRGRMYWPALSNTITTAGRFNSGAASGLAGGAATLLTYIAGLAPGGLGMEPAVVSKAGGFVTSVTQVRVGDVPDTMRSRRDALDETYSVATVG